MGNSVSSSAGHLALACCLCLALAACGRTVPAGQDLLLNPSPGKAEQGGRVSPVYERWLYRQSMLGQAQDMNDGLAGSRLLWRRTAAAQDRDLLRQAAPTWLVTDVSRIPAQGLKTLTGSVPALAAEGVRGILLIRACESDAAWLPESADPGAHDTYRQAGLNLSARSGGEEALKSLVSAMQANGLQSGMPIAPAATGLGPDFMLQARGSMSHRGMYLMLEVPETLWSALPPVERPWECRILSSGARARLVADRVIPETLRQEEAPLAQTQPTAWAVTGPVLGVDGRTRRWVYRVLGSPWQPILCWQDTRQAARATLTGSVVRVTGHRRQALACVSMAGLAGLDPAAGPAADPATDPSTPMPLALTDISQQIRRCGGWSLVTDGHSLDLMRRSPAAADFYLATGFTEHLANAMVSGDVAPLAAFLRGLVRDGVDVRSLAFAAPDQLPADKGNAYDSNRAGHASARARRAHLAMALPVGLPGLCFVSDALYTADARRTGQTAMLSQAIAARAGLNAASGRLIQVLTPQAGVLLCVTALPRGGRLITALNVSSRSADLASTLHQAAGQTKFVCLTPQDTEPAQTSALSLKPGQAAHFLAGTTTGVHGKE